MQKRIKPSIISVVILLISTVLLLLVAYSIAGSRQGTLVSPIPNGLLYPLVPEAQRLIRYHPPDYPAPIAHVPIPQHPYMASNAGNNMHNDAYMSDACEASGPLGLNPQVSSRTQGFGGHHTFPIAHPEPGVTRVDLTRGANGWYTCREIWSSNERNIGVFKLSPGNGLLYLYFRDNSPLIRKWGYPRLEPSSSFWDKSPVCV